MNSWDKSDSLFVDDTVSEHDVVCHDINNTVHRIIPRDWSAKNFDGTWIGPNDLKLLTNLANAGSDEAKFRRMIVVYVDITAPIYWWKDADTYKVGTVRNSCSTMHKIHAKEFTLEDFSTEHLTGHSTDILSLLIGDLNVYRNVYLETKNKDEWWQMIQLLPSSYNQRATLMLNYEVLANMYHARKNHKLDEWHEFCDWIETLPYAKELIIGFQMRTDIYKPTVLSKDLITVNVCEDKDGLIELRRGVPALYLGNGIEYCQARILVGDGQYIKGMCVYKDDMPEDCDVIVNTRDKDTVFKDLDYKCAFSRYSKQPLKQRFYENPNTGDFEISPINYIPWDDDWDRWSKKLPDTFLKGR